MTQDRLYGVCRQFKNTKYRNSESLSSSLSSSTPPPPPQTTTTSLYSLLLLRYKTKPVWIFMKELLIAVY